MALRAPAFSKLTSFFAQLKASGIALLWGAMLALSACSDPPLVVDQEAAPPLYEIANEAGEIEGWMLGTIHSLPDGVEWRTPQIEAVLERADSLYVEVAALTDRSELQSTFQKLATSPGQGPLSTRLGSEHRAQLDVAIIEANFSDEDFATIETWAAALMLAQTETFGDAANGVDLALLREFSDGTINEFEGAEDQLGIFDQLRPQDQRDLLLGVLEEIEATDAEPGLLARAWLSGDTQALIEATNSGILSDKELRDALLVERNTDWIEQLIPVLETLERPLVAVGAAHLVGPDGLVAILQARGYTVRSLH